MTDCGMPCYDGGTMETVLFVTDLHIGAQIDKAAGVFERARRHGWRVVEIERSRTERPLSDFVATWRPAGCILECSNLAGPADVGDPGVPAVLIDPDAETLAGPCRAVANNADAIAGCAARELEEAGCVSFAYAGWRDRTGWSLSRGEAFARRAAALGKPCAMLDEPWRESLAFQRRLARQLAGLPRRTGVFAANDYVAKHVAAACGAAGLESPRDVAIVGVDDEELICENTIPSLSSVKIDFKKAGQLAADLLARVLSGRDDGPALLEYGPSALRRRQSTRIVDTRDYRIARAVERIRRDACTGLKAADVIAETGISRRLAEKRFLAATGRTILGEIHEVRLDMAMRLLRDPSIPIGAIADQCGWESDSYLKRLLKARTGLSPCEWRRRNLE